MKLYVVVRDDLSVPQKAVQAGHALAEFLIKNETSWNNGTLVYLRVPNEEHLRKLSDRLDGYGMDYPEDSNVSSIVINHANYMNNKNNCSSHGSYWCYDDNIL